MMMLAALFGLIVAVLGVIIIEKKRKQGPITYPLWQGNLFIPWSLFAVVCFLFVGATSLPPFIKLGLKGMPVPAVINTIGLHCSATYHYTVNDKEYTGSDSQCGLKAGEERTAYFVKGEPDVSMLYPPAIALRNELIALVLICLCLPTLIVFWLKMTYVIGRRPAP